MKKVSSQIAVLLAMVIATSGAFAQTETVSGDQAPEINEGLAKASALAAKKKKKKAKAKKAAAVTPAESAAPAATLTPAPAVNPQGSAITTEAAPAAGSSTAAAPVAAPSTLSRFSGSAIFEGSSSQNSWRDNGVAGSIESVNALTGTYKINDTQKVSLRQYLAWNRNEVATGKANERTENKILPYQMFARFHQATNGILGSEKTELSMWVSVPTGDYPAIRDTGATMLRADYIPTWTVTPKVSVSYILSPRMNVIDRDNMYQDFDGKQKHLAAMFRAVHGPSVSYTFNDKNSMYLTPYLDQFFDYNNSMNYSRALKRKETSTESAINVIRGEDLARNDLNIELGYEFTQKLSPRSNLVVNPYLAKTTALDENLGAKETRWLDKDDLSYNLLLSLSL